MNLLLPFRCNSAGNCQLVELEARIFLLPIHDFRENGSTCITLRQSVSASVRQCVSASVRHTFYGSSLSTADFPHVRTSGHTTNFITSNASAGGNYMTWLWVFYIKTLMTQIGL